MEIVRSSETSVDFYRSTISEDGSLHSDRCEHLRSNSTGTHYEALLFGLSRHWSSTTVLLVRMSFILEPSLYQATSSSKLQSNIFEEIGLL
jgi:hypothetical protein